VLDRVRSEMLASVMLFPAFEAYVHTRFSCLPEEKIAEFNDRLCALMAEYWPVPEDVPEDAEKTQLAVFIYRDPGDITHE
jgi:hypothetical protein